MTAAQPPRLLAIGLDAADGPLALRWARDGRLAVLGSLLRDGAVVRLRSRGDLFPESLWPTVVTGLSLGSHGIYNWRVVTRGQHSLKWVPNAPGDPVWRILRQHDGSRRAVLVDIPYAKPAEDNGVTELIGWGQRGATRHTSWPPDLIAAVRRRHGRYPGWAHVHFHRRAPAQRRLLRTLERMARIRTSVIEELLRERPWELCIACYSEAHDGGHEFHRYLDPSSWGHGRRRARGVEDGLLRVYRALDTGVGNLIEAAGEGANVLVFSGMGMRTCTSGERLLKRVLVGLGYQVPARRQPAGLRPLVALRSRLPWSIRHLLHLRLSQPSREALMERLWLEGTDWNATRAYAEEEPGVGFVHLNVRGRDPDGTVEPGADYRALCAEITAELLSLREAESGAPAVVEVLHRDQLVIGANAEALPDLVVRFSQQRMIGAVRHPRLGLVREDVHDTPYSEHTGEGFLVGAGPGIRLGADLDADLEDLAPTMLALLEVPVPAEVEGAPLVGMLTAAAH
ncbi:MAG: alkaline phosphatase family protein [Solirubrobacteraceae bacterium]